MGIRATTDSAQPSVQQGAGALAGRHPHLVAVAALTAVAAAGYSVFALVLNYTFQTSSYDLVIFDQAVRSYAHFGPGISIIKGVHNGFGPHFSILGDHWSPILASLAPLYWIDSARRPCWSRRPSCSRSRSRRCGCSPAGPSAAGARPPSPPTWSPWRTG